MGPASDPDVAGDAERANEHMSGFHEPDAPRLEAPLHGARSDDRR